MTHCQPFNTTEIEFSNLAIKLIPPHIAFQSNTPFNVAIDFGLGNIPTASFQGIGTNQTDTTMYLLGGGAITLPTTTNIIRGSIEIKGILFFTDIIQDEFSKYNGAISLNICPSKIHKNHTIVKLEGNFTGLGVGIFNNTIISGSIFGEGRVSINCGIRKLSFPNGSISLVLDIPIGI